MSPLVLASVFFITGTSGSGKTTLTQSLKLKLSAAHFAVHDFDERGVPPNPDQAWRQATTNLWLTQAQKNATMGKSTIICGVTVPTEILQSPSKLTIPIHFGFIKVADHVIRQRLESRGWDKQLIADNINWAHHLEAAVTNQKNHLIIDTAQHSTPESIADACIRYIEHSKP